jgi:hypothetical protein
MIRRRLESTSTKPQRRRISGTQSPAIPQDERDLSNDDLGAALRFSYLAEGKRIRDVIHREIGGDVLSIVRESLGKMSGRGRRRVLSFLDRCLGVR